MIVEDDAEQSVIFTTFLKRKGLNVVTFCNSIEALENFKANINLYSLVLTDFKMEWMNGIEFSKEVRRLRGNAIIIIMITAYPIRDLVENKEVACLFDRVIMKPFSLKSLSSILDFYLQKSN